MQTTPQTTITIEMARDALLAARPELAEVLRIDPDAWLYYSYPKAFGSTAGPFGGIGGQAFTTFQIEVWEYDYRHVVIGCGKRIVKVADGSMECGLYSRDGKPIQL